MRMYERSPWNQGAHNHVALFEDVFEAGEQLAELLLRSTHIRNSIDDAVVVGVSDGGLPLAYMIGTYLPCDVRVLPVMPVHAPHQRDVRVGLVADDESVYLARAIGAQHGATGSTLDHLVDRERANIRRLRATVGDLRLADVAGRTVIVVDDAIDSGLTSTMCIDQLRRRGAAHVHVAVAVATESGRTEVLRHADSVLCLTVTEDDVPPGSLFRRHVSTSIDDVTRFAMAVAGLDLHAERPTGS